MRDNWHMAMSDVSDFGTCACSGTITLTWVEVRFSQASPEPVVINRVPQGRCGTCNSRYYKASTLRTLEQAFAEVSDTASACAL